MAWYGMYHTIKFILYDTDKKAMSVARKLRLSVRRPSKKGLRERQFNYFLANFFLRSMKGVKGT